MMVIGRLLCWTLLFFLPACDCTLCYLCNWSPEINQTDYCRDANWKPEMVGYIHCDSGCEKVTQMDKNGEVTMFYRNCFANAPLYTQCQKMPLKAGSRHVCSCNMHLCNSAPPTLTAKPLALILFILLLLLTIVM